MHKVEKIRLTFIFFSGITLTCIALIHAYRIQIVQHNFFLNLAHHQYNVTITNYPPRATILDRNNRPLALNKNALSAFIFPQKLTQKERVMNFLKKNFPDGYAWAINHPTSRFVYIKRRLSSEQITIIEQSNLNDIHIVTEPSRFYPVQNAGGITGITDIDNQGLFGIELTYNQQLRGEPSTIILQKDARSGRYYFSKEIQDEGVLGTDVQLTIDGDIQFLVQEELNETIAKYHSYEGGAVVLDPETGDILALASCPTFDPNHSEKLDQETTRCSPISQSYEFGSVMKTFCALAALEEHVVTPDEKIDCMGRKTVFIDGRKINTVSHTILGKASFKDIMKKSNNIGIAQVAKRIGTHLYDHYQKLGFGTKIGLPLPGEQAGFIMPPTRWSKQSIISLSYGYEITGTLLQLARAFSVFLNDGCLITPRLLLHKPIKKSEPLYSHEAIEIMREILHETMTQGTGKYASIEGYTCLGKTGTANLLDRGIYNKNKNLFCFMGSIEKGNYKRIIACYIKESGQKNVYAATVTGPLFQKIADRLLVHDTVW